MVPWLATALVGAGATAAATLGSLGMPGQSPSAWVSRLLATTQAAGTAHVVLTSIISGAQPTLHQRSRSVGVADLSRGNFEIRTTRTRSQSPWSGPSQQVGLGLVVYSVQPLPVPSRIAAETGTYLVLRQSRRKDREAFGLGPVSVALAGLTSPARAVQVRWAGSATVDGAPATRYQVDATRHLCTSTVTTTTEVWVDDRGRLVQARTVLPYPFPFQFRGTTTFTQTVRFSRFGEPVTITPPKPTPVAQSAVSGSGESRATTLRCG